MDGRRSSSPCSVSGRQTPGAAAGAGHSTPTSPDQHAAGGPGPGPAPAASSTTGTPSSSLAAAGPATAVATSTSASPMSGGVPSAGVPSNKIIGRNTNGTVVMTSVPSNEAELQLYRVMQRASLLAYYDTLLEMGGDDVRQLCEAGEEEFLEIMALVGMASKPLHVRRLQKALHEWCSNPAQFLIPLGPTPAFPVAAPRPGVPVAVPAPLGTPLGTTLGTPLGTPLAVPGRRSPPPNHSSPVPSTSPAPSVRSTTPADLAPQHLNRSSTTSPVTMSSTVSPPPPAPPQHADPMQTAVGSVPVDFSTASTTTTTTTASNNNNHHHHHAHNNHHLHQQHQHHAYHGRPSPSSSPLHAGGGRPLSPAPSTTPRPLSPSLQLTPVLIESQIQRLAEAARSLAPTLPSYEPRPHNTKKKMCKDLELVMNMSDDDPRRMDEIRKYAAIYGRFDCKRKPEKPLTLHEVSVNEAAAQICRYVPALLTLREKLFPLARQLVRDAGYLYSKGHSNLSYYRPRCPSSDDILTAGHKRPRLEPSGSPSPDSSEGDREKGEHRAEHRQRRQERLEALSEELRALSERHEDLMAASGLHDVVGLQQLQVVRDALQARQLALQAEQAELIRKSLQPRSWRRTVRVRSSSLTMDSERGDTDEDSQLSFSNASSPSQEVGDSRDSETIDRVSRSPSKQDGTLDSSPMGNGIASLSNGIFSESKIQVIASKGSDIIAVANPALSMSSTLSTTGRPGDPSTPPSAAQVRLSPRADLLKLEPQSPPSSPGLVH